MELLELAYIICGALLAYILYKFVNRVRASYRCPDDELLRDFYHGRLKREEDLRRSITHHLGVCEKCQERLYDLQKE
jgi:hypothetical protein